MEQYTQIIVTIVGVLGSASIWKYLEARLKAIIEEATDPMNGIIMFIDEVHTIIGA